MARRGEQPEEAAAFPYTGIRGMFSHVREYPPWPPPKRTQGAPPLDPAIAGLQLEGLHALRSVGAVYMASP